MAPSSRAWKGRRFMPTGCASGPPTTPCISPLGSTEALACRGPILKTFAAEVFGQVDLLATPTIPTCLPTLAETDIDHGPPGTEQRFMAVSVNTRPFNYLGLPAASAPCGLDPNGLPIGLQIAGRPFAEARVLKAVDALSLIHI